VKYDYSKVKLETWERLASWTFQVLDGGAETFPLRAALQQVKTEARVKTRAEYDREIGDMCRDQVHEDFPDGYAVEFRLDKAVRIRALINASRNAPEE
jgi:hypothetical protein